VSRFVARWERENPMKKGKARQAKRAKKESQQIAGLGHVWICAYWSID